MLDGDQALLGKTGGIAVHGDLLLCEKIRKAEALHPKSFPVRRSDQICKIRKKEKAIQLLSRVGKSQMASLDCIFRDIYKFNGIIGLYDQFVLEIFFNMKGVCRIIVRELLVTWMLGNIELIREEGPDTAQL